jgi:hypothetical protein
MTKNGKRRLNIAKRFKNIRHCRRGNGIQDVIFTQLIPAANIAIIKNGIASLNYGIATL